MNFLSREDLQWLTGYKRPADQRKWLVKSGYRFEVNADGVPVVLWSHVERRLDDKVSESSEPKLRLDGTSS